MVSFKDRLLAILGERDISISRFEQETGIHRCIFTRNRNKKPRKATLLAIAYVLDMRVEDLIKGTDAEEYYYT